MTDEWALRKLTICVRRQADLLYARELVRHLAQPGPARDLSELYNAIRYF
jgi:hypothetical protein